MSLRDLPDRRGAADYQCYGMPRRDHAWDDAAIADGVAGFGLAIVAPARTIVTAQSR